MAVSKRLRYEILRRDNHTCRYCGATAPDVKLTVDHVVPVALGGSDVPTNLVAACDACNGCMLRLVGFAEGALAGQLGIETAIAELARGQLANYGQEVC